MKTLSNPLIYAQWDNFFKQGKFNKNPEIYQQNTIIFNITNYKTEWKNAHLEYYMQHRKISFVLHESKKQQNPVTWVKHSIPLRKHYFVWEKFSKFSSFLFQFSLLSRYIWVVIAKRQMAASNGKGWNGNPSVERGATVQLMSRGRRIQRLKIKDEFVSVVFFSMNRVIITFNACKYFEYMQEI